ncbi:MAG: hypothetical protein IJJ32_05145 [Eggerthellaceae bacterium]|nr:hypothetical protein [Eggerthellaceae bacterium]
MEQTIIWVVLAVFVIFVAVKSLKQRNQDGKKTLDQRREETYARYEQRMEEFRKTEMKKDESSEE